MYLFYTSLLEETEEGLRSHLSILGFQSIINA